MRLLLRLVRWALCMGPTTAERHRIALLALGASMSEGLAEGVRDPRPLTAEEADRVAAHAGLVARRSFGALYEDEGQEPGEVRR